MVFRTHVFVCTNKRPDGHERGCCIDRGGGPIRDYMKKRCAELGVEGVRINAAGCLDRCEEGPVMVVYPDGVWYRLTTTEQVDRVVAEHIIGGKPVEEYRI